MNFKNSFKIMIAKFSTAWSMFGYYLVAAIIVGTAGAAVLIPFFDSLKSLNLAEDYNVMVKLLVEEDAFTKISNYFIEIYKKVVDFFKIPKVGLSIKLFFLLIIGVMARLLFGFSELAITGILDGHMSAKARYGFLSTYLQNLGKSVRYQVIKIFFTLPYDFLIYLVMRALVLLYAFTPIRLFLPLIIMMSLIILIAFRMTALACWGPAIIIDKMGVFKGIKKSFAIIFCKKMFWSIFSQRILIIVITFTFNMFILMFTMGAGLFITIPMTILWYSAFNMTVYYTATGRRFYTDTDTVVTSPREIPEKNND